MAKKTKFEYADNGGTLTLFDGDDPIGNVAFDLKDFPPEIVRRAAVYGIGKLGKDTYTSVVSATGEGTPAEGIEAIRDRYVALKAGEWREKAGPGLGSTMELEVFMSLYPKDIKSLDDARAYREAGQEDEVWKSITKHPAFRAKMDAARAARSNAKAKEASALPSL